MSSYDFATVERVTVGTVGPPGSRVFLFQATAGGTTVTLKLEKQQVAALVEYLVELVADRPPASQVPQDLDLTEPTEPEWVIGAMGISQWDDTTGLVLLVAEEAVPEGEDGAVARFAVDRDQVEGLIRRGRDLVTSGRPMCQFCGLPIDPTGHACPRMNGHHER